MLRRDYVLLLFFIFIFQSTNAENLGETEEPDEEFLEMLGSFEAEAEDDDWYDYFWSTIEGTEIIETQNEEHE